MALDGIVCFYYIYFIIYSVFFILLLFFVVVFIDISLKKGNKRQVKRNYGQVDPSERGDRTDTQELPRHDSYISGKSQWDACLKSLTK